MASGLRRAKEDLSKASRQELQPQESPSSKAAYKHFVRIFAQKEAADVDDALAFASQEAASISREVRWRVLGDAADLSRRLQRFDDVSLFFKSHIL